MASILVCKLHTKHFHFIHSVYFSIFFSFDIFGREEENISMRVYLHCIKYILHFPKWKWLSARVIFLWCCHLKSNDLNLCSILRYIYDKISARIKFDFIFETKTGTSIGGGFSETGCVLFRIANYCLILDFTQIEARSFGKIGGFNAGFDSKLETTCPEPRNHKWKISSH